MNRIKLFSVALGLLLMVVFSPLFAGTTICSCSGSVPLTYSCAGVGSSCSQAMSNFHAFCDDQVYDYCIYGVCSLQLNSPSSCTQYPVQPGVYYAHGSVTYSCVSCIDYQD